MKVPVFDGHCDTLYRLSAVPGAAITDGKGQWDLNRLERLDPMAQFFAVFWDSASPKAETEAMVEKELRTFRQLCNDYSDRMTHCRTAAEAEAACAAGKVAAFLSVEGAELIGCSIEELERVYDLGVRAVNLTWNYANVLSGSNKEETHRGLSPQGRDFVRRMQQLGVLVDVSHLSDAGFWDVIELTQRPIIATHSNSRTICGHSRNLTDEMFTALVKNNGVTGLNGYTAFLGSDPVTEKDMLAHLEHFLSLGGEHTVALGGDWDGCDSLPEGYTGVWNWADFCETLLRRNYSEELVRDLFFNNMLRTVRLGCG